MGGGVCVADSSVVSATLCVIPLGSQEKINTITILLVKATVEALYKSITNSQDSSNANSQGKNLFSIFVFSSSLSLSPASTSDAS